MLYTILLHKKRYLQHRDMLVLDIPPQKGSMYSYPLCNKYLSVQDQQRKKRDRKTMLAIVFCSRQTANIT